MSSLPLTSLLDMELQPGKPPILRAEATGDARRLGGRTPGRIARRRGGAWRGSGPWHRAA